LRGGVKSFGTNDWFMERRRSTHSSFPRSAALTRMRFRKTSDPSIGTRRPAFPTVTVSTGGAVKNFGLASASRYTTTSFFGFLKETRASFLVQVRSMAGFSGCGSGLCQPSL
jgi:hypothetical protein